jgi:hypothetical protein
MWAVCLHKIAKMTEKLKQEYKKANVSYLLTPLKHPEIFIPTKRHIKSIFIPNLCFEIQTWTLNQNQTQFLCNRVKCAVSEKNHK